MENSVDIGRYVSMPGADGGALRFLCDAPELERHIGQPWFRAYASERLDIPLAAMEGADVPAGAARVEADQLARHVCVFGATGSGKTRLALHLLAEQIKAGCSVVMLDPKIETIRHLLSLAHSLGMAPEQVTVLSPHLSGAGAPGWNPLDGRASGISPAQAAADVVSVLEKSTSSWGPRMGDLLTNALIVIASHGLSLFELARLLQRDDYREGLLRLPSPHDGPGHDVAYEEARDFFLSEFAAWSKSERAAAVAPVLNKFRELLRTPFLRSLLCARRTTLHLGSLWHRPGLVLVHLDTAALGDEGVRLLGGLLAHQLLRTAMRSDGPVPVVLALDEMGVSEEFVGGAAAKILAIARSRGLRLLVACQHLDQLSDGLRTALLANTAVRAFFRLGYADAKLVAATLAAGTGERVSRIAADVAKRDAGGLPEGWAEAAHTVRDGQGEPVKLSSAAGQAFWHLAHKAGGPAQIEGLKRLARVSGIDRLYVHAADTKKPVELSRYLRGLCPEDYRLLGSGPVRLVVRFPPPPPVRAVAGNGSGARAALDQDARRTAGAPGGRADGFGRGGNGAGSGGGGPRSAAGLRAVPVGSYSSQRAVCAGSGAGAGLLAGGGRASCRGKEWIEPAGSVGNRRRFFAPRSPHFIQIRFPGEYCLRAERTIIGHSNRNRPAKIEDA